MKTFRVSMHYEVGVYMDIKASSAEEAEELAKESMNSDGCPENVGEVVHRDYFICDSKEI